MSKKGNFLFKSFDFAYKKVHQSNTKVSFNKQLTTNENTKHKNTVVTQEEYNKIKKNVWHYASLHHWQKQHIVNFEEAHKIESTLDELYFDAIFK